MLHPGRQLEMNVAVLHPSLNSGGGSERVCLTIIEALKESGHSIALGTFEKTKWSEVAKFFGNVARPDKEIIKPRVLGRFAYGEMVNFFFLASKMPDNCDATIVSSTSPWCYGPHSEKLVMYMLPPLGYEKKLWKVYLRPYAFAQQKHLRNVRNKILLTNSSFSAKKIKEIYALKTDVLYPPVNIENFYSSKKEDLVVSVGRFDPLKRYEILIEAFRGIKKNANCIIIGTGVGDTFSKSKSYLFRLRELINKFGLTEKIKLFVNCPFDTLTRILSKAKLYVHCFYNEPFGISIVESMAAGCVPIVHRSGGAYEDVIDHDRYGFSFEDVNDLRSKINLLFGNDSLCREYSRKAIKRSKRFSRKTFKKKILGMVESN